MCLEVFWKCVMSSSRPMSFQSRPRVPVWVEAPQLLEQNGASFEHANVFTSCLGAALCIGTHRVGCCDAGYISATMGHTVAAPPLPPPLPPPGPASMMHSSCARTSCLIEAVSMDASCLDTGGKKSQSQRLILPEQTFPEEFQQALHTAKSVPGTEPPFPKRVGGVNPSPSSGMEEI